MRKYIKPKSLTWWASVVPLVAGTIVATGPLHGVEEIVQTIDNFTGNMQPALLINMGLAGIGLRGALS